MNSSRGLGAITWLLNRFGCSDNTESVLGDLVEQYRTGKSRSWYRRQIAIILLVSLRGVVLGLGAGAVSASLSIIENVRRSDSHLVSFFPDATGPILLAVIVYATIWFWLRSGHGVVVVRRALRQAGRAAAIVTAISHAALVHWWWYGRIPFSSLLQISLMGSAMGYLCVCLLVMISGRLALKLTRASAVT